MITAGAHSDSGSPARPSRWPHCADRPPLLVSAASDTTGNACQGYLAFAYSNTARSSTSTRNLINLAPTANALPIVNCTLPIRLLASPRRLPHWIPASTPVPDARSLPGLTRQLSADRSPSPPGFRAAAEANTSSWRLQISRPSRTVSCFISSTDGQSQAATSHHARSRWRPVRLALDVQAC